MTLEGWPDVARAATDVEPWVWPPGTAVLKALQELSTGCSMKRGCFSLELAADRVRCKASASHQTSHKHLRREDCICGFLAHHHILHHEHDRVCIGLGAVLPTRAIVVSRAVIRLSSRHQVIVESTLEAALDQKLQAMRDQVGWSLCDACSSVE